MARRTLYWQYNVPVKVGMSLSFLPSARKMIFGMRLAEGGNIQRTEPGREPVLRGGAHELVLRVPGLHRGWRGVRLACGGRGPASAIDANPSVR
jgi:hypothetical protein